MKRRNLSRRLGWALAMRVAAAIGTVGAVTLGLWLAGVGPAFVFVAAAALLMFSAVLISSAYPEFGGAQRRGKRLWFTVVTILLTMALVAAVAAAAVANRWS